MMMDVAYDKVHIILLHVMKHSMCFAGFCFSELLKFQGPNDFEKETWTMSPAEKLAVVPKLKEIGNTLYKARQYEEASDKYAEALGILEQLLML